MAKVTSKQMAVGSKSMSQRDVMGKAMSASYAKTYGSPITAAPAKPMKGPGFNGAAYAFDADNTYGKTSPSMANSTPQAKLKAAKPMSPDAIASRKRSKISNAASKVMGGLFSK